MTEEKYHEYIAHLEMVCEMCRLAISSALLLPKDIVTRAERILRETEEQIESLRKTYARYEKPTQAE